MISKQNYGSYLNKDALTPSEMLVTSKFRNIFFGFTIVIHTFLF